MAGSHTRCNTGKAPTNDNGISVPTPAVFCALTVVSAQTPVPIETPLPTQAPALTFAPVSISVSGSPGRYMDEDL